MMIQLRHENGKLFFDYFKNFQSHEIRVFFLGMLNVILATNTQNQLLDIR